MRSDSHLRRQQHALQHRLLRSEKALSSLRPKPDESKEAFLARAHQLLLERQTDSFFSLDVSSATSTHKRYLQPGRPSPTSLFEIVYKTHLSLVFTRNLQAISDIQHQLAWRILLSFSPHLNLSLLQAILHYRQEWLVEHGVHRFKHGSLPVLALFLRSTQRIRGLMLLLFLALQALTLLEFVAHRSLTQQKTPLQGIFPGNPKRSTSHPSAERLLASFDSLHLIIEGNPSSLSCFLLEPLSPLQSRILDILQLSPSLFFFPSPPHPT